MLFGMSNRAGWTGQDPNDNAGLWALWDRFGIEDATMYGWWNRPMADLQKGATVALTMRAVM